ncbi:MAG: glutamate-cysteine ligase family protein [Gammaproteobacteria bacterium]|nr:glutamate-cysteine ligase family protein [Gammaproteobacteria bacterium]
MGEEILYSHYNKSDYLQFLARIEEETALVKSWFEQHRFASTATLAGYELEAWLLDQQGNPAAINDVFLNRANNPLLSPELARFNVELNVEPERLTGNALSSFEHKLDALWQQCANAAESLDSLILGIGILPTLRDTDLTLNNISLMDRYKALNEQILRQRDGLEIELNISGEEHLQVRHRDVMLEAAATSLQIHIQVPQEVAVRYYNASILLSSVMVAVSANSPCLFGKRLWQETRIPVFEQAVPTGGYGGAASGPLRRVSFGTGYARDSLFECFQENLQHFPILLPVHYQAKRDELRHLRLHNGTIWRWNRPLIGFDEAVQPHLRIEHRVCASAPSTIDNIANIAFYYGLVHYYATLDEPPESRLPFADAKHDFYRAAQLGLKHKTHWFDDKVDTLQTIILERLLDQAETGLAELGINQQDGRHYLAVIRQRIEKNRTGSQWQLDFLKAHNNDQSLLTLTYLNNQKTGRPVHEWDLEAIPC